MKALVVAASLLTSLGANAAGLPCSIHPKKGIAVGRGKVLARKHEGPKAQVAEKAADGV